MARRERVTLFDPTDDPELIEQARDLGKLGEIAFLNGVASAAETLIPNDEMPIELWVREARVFIPASKTTRGGLVRLTGIQRGVCRMIQTFGTDSVVLLKGPRIGASTLTAILLLYYSCHEQSDVLLYERSKGTAQTFSKDKLMPILRASTNLKILLRPDGKTGEQDTWDNRELLNGASIKHVSIENDDSFKGIRGRFIAGEEGGDAGWTTKPGSKEGSKIERMRRRGQEFADGKVYLSGTPTLKGSCLISAEYEATDRCVFVMSCPHCGERQPFHPDVRQSLDPTVRHGPGIRYVLDNRRRCTDAWYECANLECSSPNGRIDESYKSSMMEDGDFEPTVTTGEPGRRGAFVWLAHSEDDKATWKHIGADHDRQFVRGGEEERKEFTNLVLGLPFDPQPTSAVDAGILEGRIEVWEAPDGARFDLPKWAEMMSVGIDCQQGSLDDLSKPPRVEATVMVTGANRRRAVIKHEIIAYRDVVDAFSGEIERVPVEPFTAACSDLIWDFLDRDWITEDGRTLRIGATFVDNGWRPDDANRFCKLPRSRQLGIVPIRGASTERNGSRAPLLPASLTLSRSQRSGREYLFIGTQTAKDTLGRILSIPAPGPESLVFAEGLPAGYFQGLLAEREVEIRPGVRVWRPISKAETGEPWDCLVYAYAAERYQIRRSSRLRKLVDEIDPEAVTAALVAQAEIAAPMPVDPPKPEVLSFSVDAPADDPPSDGPRFRVVERTKKRRPTVDLAAQDRARRIARRPGRKGIGW